MIEKKIGIGSPHPFRLPTPATEVTAEARQFSDRKRDDANQRIVPSGYRKPRITLVNPLRGCIGLINGAEHPFSVPSTFEVPEETCDRRPDSVSTPVR